MIWYSTEQFTLKSLVNKMSKSLYILETVPRSEPIQGSKLNYNVMNSWKHTKERCSKKRSYWKYPFLGVLFLYATICIHNTKLAFTPISNYWQIVHCTKISDFIFYPVNLFALLFTLVLCYLFSQPMKVVLLYSVFFDFFSPVEFTYSDVLECFACRGMWARCNKQLLTGRVTKQNKDSLHR